MIQNIEKIRSSAPVVDIIKEHVDLKRQGSNYIGLCPFHNEKTPSLVVSPSKNTFKCFGCGEGGDAVHFLIEHKGMTYPEALEEAAKYARIKVEYNGTPKQELIAKHQDERKQKEALFILLEAVATAYTNNVFDQDIFLQKVECAGRIYSIDTVQKFSLSWAPKNYISKIYQDQQWDLDLLLKIGIIKLSDTNHSRGGTYDYFRDRLLFPIRNHKGKVAGFGGRKPKSDKNKKNPKYLNSPESIIYKKQELLYGLYENKRSIRDGVFLVEGYTDVITMYEHGYAAVASCGTAFTFNQAKLLKRYTESVIILRDGDEAGKKASIKDVEIAVRAGLEPKILFLPNDLDPDDFLRKYGKLGLEEELKNNLQDAITWRIMLEWSEDPFQREKAYRIAGQFLAQIDSKTLRETYIRELTKKSNMGSVKQILKDAIEEYQKQNLSKESPLSTAQQNDVMDYGLYIKGNKYFTTSDINNEGIAISNFTVHPLMLVIGSKESQQLVEICNEYGRSFIMNMDRKALTNLQTFKTETERMGNFVFTGSPQTYDKVKAKIYKETDDCFPINVMGLHRERFFVWGNGISVDGKFIHVDEYGIVEHDKTKYFLPAFSKVQSSLKGDDMEEQYEFEKKFRFYQDPDCISFTDWSRRFTEVFEGNGTMGLSWALAAIFRDVIFAKFQFFPHLNLFGPSGSGKTFMARSIMSLFGRRNSHDPFNLASGTPVAFKRRLSQVSNGIIWFDEYSNDVDFKRVEALKGAYDGAGHETGIKSNDNRTKTTKVKSAVLVSGQQQPTKDIALFKRCITMNFKAGKNTLERQIKAKELNEIEQSGQLTQIVQYIMKYRSLIEENFSIEFETLRIQFNKLIEDNDQYVEDRIVNNHLIPITVSKMLMEHIDFGFTMEELFKFTFNNIVTQSESIFSEDELSIFWRIVEYLMEKDIIRHKQDFMVEEKTQETFQNRLKKGEKKDSNLVRFDRKTKLIYIRFSKLHPEYQERHQRQRNKPGLDLQALQYYLQNSPNFLGSKRQKKFGSKNYSCYVFDVDQLPIEPDLSLKHYD